MRRESKLDSLLPEERKELIKRLYRRQDGCSYISKKEIDLKVHEVEIDHITSLDRGGIDNESNWGLVLKSENRTKGTKDLQLMRYIYKFRQHRDKYLSRKKDFTFGDALIEFHQRRYPLRTEVSENTITISFKEEGEVKKLGFPLLTDERGQSD